MTTRRDLVKFFTLAPMMVAVAPTLRANPELPHILREIPSSGELLPSVGMGSYQTFNVAKDSIQRENLLKVLDSFFSAGGCLIDSSPMYGKSESVLGDLLTQLSLNAKVFAASKVWTYGKQAGIEAIAESQRRMQVDKMDLMQVHNLRDWRVQLNTLNQLKQEDKLRYTGITTSSLGQYKDFEEVMRKEPLDFVQLNYNIKVREAEKRLLPLAQDKGIAVIVNMPFEKGRLFKYAGTHSLPEWASEIDCTTWGQFFLKFILSHPAVTCVIPATSKVNHMQDNMQAMTGRLPGKKMRQKMQQFFDGL